MLLVWFCVNTTHAFASVSTAAEEQGWAKAILLPPSGSMGQQFSSLLDNKQLDVVSYTSVQAGTLGQDAQRMLSYSNHRGCSRSVFIHLFVYFTVFVKSDFLNVSTSEDQCCSVKVSIKWNESWDCPFFPIVTYICVNGWNEKNFIIKHLNIP